MNGALGELTEHTTLSAGGSLVENTPQGTAFTVKLHVPAVSLRAAVMT
jgi:hypothetical protein